MVASWMPSSPDEWTDTPSWKVSQIPAALTHARMPPQNVVSRSTTSTLRCSTLVASCSKFTTTVLVASGVGVLSRTSRSPSRPQTGSSR